ncbi:MAG: hypothetical protein AAFP84_11925 [Actinomycetota bacterium]
MRSLARSTPRSLRDRFVPVDSLVIDEIHVLVDDIKRRGAVGDLSARWSDLAASIDADRIVLGCTELPLVAAQDDERCVDVTRLVAAALLAA